MTNDTDVDQKEASSSSRSGAEVNESKDIEGLEDQELSKRKASGIEEKLNLLSDKPSEVEKFLLSEVNMNHWLKFS